jgi:hypothetical protein
LIVVSAVLAYFYATSMYSVISNMVAIEKLQSKTAALSASVSDLDSKYLALSSRLTPDALKSYGLTSGSVSEFVSRTSSLGSAKAEGHEL